MFDLYELPGVYLEIASAHTTYGIESVAGGYREENYNQIRFECAHHNIIIEEMEAACESAGTSKRVCIESGEIMENIIIPAYGHDYGDWIVAREPNVGVAGKLYRTCSLCNKTETYLIPPLEPDTEEPTTKEAPIATSTDVNNTTSPKIVNGAMPMGAAVLGILSLVSAVALKRKHKSL